VASFNISVKLLECSRCTWPFVVKWIINDLGESVKTCLWKNRLILPSVQTETNCALDSQSWITLIRDAFYWSSYTVLLFVFWLLLRGRSESLLVFLSVCFPTCVQICHSIFSLMLSAPHFRSPSALNFALDMCAVFVGLTTCGQDNGAVWYLLLYFTITLFT